MNMDIAAARYYTITPHQLKFKPVHAAVWRGAKYVPVCDLEAEALGHMQETDMPTRVEKIQGGN